MERLTNGKNSLIQNIVLRDARKIGVFAVSGAVGCLLAAIVGEIWLRGTHTPVVTDPTPAAYKICLLLDCSGSMNGGKLEEMKLAAVEFVSGRDLSKDNLAVVGFGSFPHTAIQLTRDSTALTAAIRELDDGGGTNMGAGLRAAETEVNRGAGPKSILLFTDGMPDNEGAALRAAKSCRNSGIEVVAVATGDADLDFLARATGDRSLVFPAVSGQFASAFQQASNVIGRRQLLESEGGGGSYFWEVTRLSIWTALIAAGLSLALVIGQNLYFGRALWRSSEGLAAIVGGLVVGAISGAVVQSVFGATVWLPSFLVVAGRLVGWTALGAMIGVAITRFVPNLRTDRGLLGGVAGGAIGGVLFLILAIVGDAGGRISGAMAVGLAIGAMIAIAEVAGRQAWLDVMYGPREKRTITLGSQKLAIGSDKEHCQILIHGAPTVALRYLINDGRVLVEDVPVGRTFEVYDGDTRQVGKVCLIVRLAGMSARNHEGSQTALSRDDEPANSQRERWTTVDGVAPARAENTVATALSVPADRMAQATGFFLNAGGRLAPLVEGARFTAQQLALRDGFVPADVCAEVVQNPNQPGVFGLKNLTNKQWRAVLESGETREIDPGKSIRLAKGTRIIVGQTSLSIE